MELSLPDWQQQILEERLAEDDADPEAGSSWEEVKERILASLTLPPSLLTSTDR
jgi:putative addiction module component (TIGR02574 family)